VSVDDLFADLNPPAGHHGGGHHHGPPAPALVPAPDPAGSAGAARPARQVRP
jgi:hypothetical protein